MAVDLSTLTIGEIRDRYIDSSLLTPAVLKKMRSDPRRGVQNLCRVAGKKLWRRRKELERVEALLKLERELWNSGYRHVAGLDEAGVGPLAGPVVAAAVVFPPGALIAGVDDSKRLAPARREALAKAIKETASAIGIGMASVAEIDRINIYRAAILAMKRSVDNLPFRPEHLLIDARQIPDLPIRQHSVIRGDRAHFSIAAASIVAKTYRDALMIELDSQFPAYGFARHKGYCTALHQQALRQHGCCPIHRRSFGFVQELTGSCSSSFYDLGKKLKECSSTHRLALLGQQLKALKPCLSAQEYKKLRLLLARKREMLCAAGQLSFF